MCQAWSETTMLVFPQGGSNPGYLYHTAFIVVVVVYLILRKSWFSLSHGKVLRFPCILDKIGQFPHIMRTVKDLIDINEI